MCLSGGHTMSFNLQDGKKTEQLCKLKKICFTQEQRQLGGTTMMNWKEKLLKKIKISSFNIIEEKQMWICASAPMCGSTKGQS